MQLMKCYGGALLRACLIVWLVTAILANVVQAYTVRPNATNPYSWEFKKAGWIVDLRFQGVNTGWYDTFYNAQLAWNNQTSNPFYFYGQDDGNRIDAYCSSSFDNTWNDGDGITLARTTVYYSGSRYTQFDVVVNRCNITGGQENGNKIAFYDGTQAASIPSNYFDLQSSLKHELGHALGLCHTATDGRSMYYNLNYGEVQAIAYDDNAGARWIYNRSSITTALPEQETCRS